MLCSILGVIFTLLSCNEDKGNYDYTEVSSVYQIIGIDSLYNIEPGETLMIEPELVLNDSLVSSIDNYRFEWYGYLKSSILTQDAIFLGDEKILTLPITGEWGKPTQSDANYTIVCKVINKDTDIASLFTSKLNVNLQTRYGYLFLSKKAGNTFDVDVIARFGKDRGYSDPYTYASYKNIFRTLNNIDLNAQPIAIAASPDILSPAIGKEKYGLFLFTDKYSTKLDPVDYSYKDEYSFTKMFETWSPLYNTMPIIKNASDVYVRNTGTQTQADATSYQATLSQGNMVKMHLFVNDNWYFYTTTNVWYYFDYPINRLLQKDGTYKRYNPAPYVAGNLNTAALFFNKDDRKFLVQEYATGRPNVIRATMDTVTSEVHRRMMFEDTDDPNTELVYMSDYRQDEKYNVNGFAIMKGNSPEYRCVTFRCSKTGPTLDNHFKRFYLPAEVQNAKSWIMKNNILLCTTEDNKIYQFSWNSNDLKPDKEATPIKPVGKGDSYWSGRYKDITTNFITDSYNKISCFKAVDDIKNKYNYISQGYSSMDGSIILATYDPGGKEGENGKVQILKYDKTEATLVANNLNMYDGSAATNTFTGLGEVVDVTYKAK